MEEKIDRQAPERLEDDVSILTADEQATAAQLRLMDPQLAGKAAERPPIPSRPAELLLRTPYEPGLG